MLGSSRYASVPSSTRSASRKKGTAVLTPMFVVVAALVEVGHCEGRVSVAGVLGSYGWERTWKSGVRERDSSVCWGDGG